MRAFYDGLDIHIKLGIAILQFLVIYRFYVYYILKPAKKAIIFWQIVGYFIVAGAGYYYLRNFQPAIFAEYFYSVYAVKLYSLILAPAMDHAFYLPLFTGTVLVFRHYFLYKIFPEKSLKHGPDFVPTESQANDGVYVGDFNQDVLPPHVRGFTRRFTNKLIIPYNRLSRGITILGNMGSGKSRLMQILEETVREKYPDVPVLIHDPKGEWLRTFYNPETDLIFAPFDKRSASWDVMRDFKENPEMLHSVVSTSIEAHHSGNSDRFWSDKAVDLIKEALTYPDLESAKKYLLHKKKLNRDDKTFLSIYSSATIGFKDIAAVQLMNLEEGEISSVHPSTNELTIKHDGILKTFKADANIISIVRPGAIVDVSISAGQINIIPRKEAKKISKPRVIKDFINHNGRIFLLNNPACKAEQAGALTLFLSAFLMKTISEPDLSEHQLRAVAMVDEALTFHLPVDVETSVYSQSRSKGLCIIASAQWLPRKAEGERGLWANMASHIFAMRISDLDTRASFSQRIGKLLYNEKQKSVSTGEKNSSSTTSEVEKQHHAFAPEDYGNLKNREFILFHEGGVAPGRVRDIDSRQNDEVKTIDYTQRRDLIEFMKDL